MELRQLTYFAKAAELQNFTAAAAALFITQSTLSQQIKQLEDELGLPLFDRIAKRVRLTEAGKAFLPYARKTLKDTQDGRDTLSDLMELKTGVLSIGVTYGLTSLLTRAVAKFSAQYSQIKLLIVFGTTQYLLQQVEEGRLDLLLSFYNQADNDRITIDPLFSSKLSLIAHRDHSVAAKKHVSLNELVSLPLILPSKGYSIRHYLDSVLQKQDLSASPSMEVNDIYTLLQLIQTGLWVSVLMNSTIRDHPELKAIAITGADMRGLATIAWPKDAYRKKSATTLSDWLIMYASDYQMG